MNNRERAEFRRLCLVVRRLGGGASPCRRMSNKRLKALRLIRSEWNAIDVAKRQVIVEAQRREQY